MKAEIMGVLLNILFVLPWAGSLITLQRVFKVLKRNVKAKKALEEEVLRVVHTDETARASIAGAIGTPAEIDKAVEVITAAAAKLDDINAKQVLRALGQGKYEGNTYYVEDVARHVNSKLAREHSDANPPSTIATA